MTLSSRASAPPSTQVPTITVKAIVGLLHYARQRNPLSDDLAALAEPLADRLKERVPSARLIEVLEVAVRATGDEDFALHFSESAPLEHLDLLAYLVASNPDLAAGLADGARFTRLQNEGVEVRFVPDSAEPRFVVSTDPLGLPRDRIGIIQENVLVIAMALRVARAISGVDIAPRSVSFATPRPRNTTELERFFRARLRFNAPVTEMMLSHDALALPLRNADPGLHAVLVRYAEDVIERLPPALGTWTDQVRHLLMESACAEAMELPVVAKRFAVTPRTLQRRLHDEGTSFQTLLDEVRRELSMRYLRDPRRSVSEVAYLLGFREVSAFYRGFKRWTGLTPAEFRRRTR